MLAREHDWYSYPAGQSSRYNVGSRTLNIALTYIQCNSRHITPAHKLILLSESKNAADAHNPTFTSKYPVHPHNIVFTLVLDYLYVLCFSLYFTYRICNANTGSIVHLPLLNPKWMLPNSTIVVSIWYISAPVPSRCVIKL